MSDALTISESVTKMFERLVSKNSTLTCGDVIEALCLVNINIANWLEKAGMPAEDTLVGVYTVATKWIAENKKQKGEDEGKGV